MRRPSPIACAHSSTSALTMRSHRRNVGRGGRRSSTNGRKSSTDLLAHVIADLVTWSTMGKSKLVVMGLVCALTACKYNKETVPVRRAEAGLRVPNQQRVV